jgi:hypothetical protein
MNDCEAPLIKVSTEQLTILLFKTHPDGADTNLAPTGNVNVTNTLEADCGPALVTFKV